MRIKKTYTKKIFILLYILSVFMSVIIIKNETVANAERNNVTAECVMEVNSNRVLHSTNQNEKMFMASTTKILTAITVIENCNVDEEVIVSDESVGIEGSSIYLEVGEILSVKDLLFGLMLRSGNDCAETLALHVGKSIQGFADMMNKKAKEIGAKNSNFVNPHGLHDDEHYTTAYDLALISSYAIKNPVFKEIVSTKSVIIPFTTRNTVRKLINKNKMLNEFEGATGIKTGYTKKAGRCLVSSGERKGMEIVSVVLNCAPMFERSKDLLNDAFSDYSPVKIAESDEIVDFIPTHTGEDCPIIIKKDVVIPLKKTEIDTINIVLDLPKNISTSIEKDKIIGKMKIYSSNNLIYEQNLYTMINVG